MRLEENVTFRKDLLFNGAVQISWYENDPVQAEKAAQNYVFHGPKYHGVAKDDFENSGYGLVDTASFTRDILKALHEGAAEEPFTMAIAGYGTGKSHLAVTLSLLLSDPSSEISKRIIKNISMADEAVGRQVLHSLQKAQPYIVVAINGMKDFDLSGEIIRQVLATLHRHEIDTSVLENLRPRFKNAVFFTESFFEPLRKDFSLQFGEGCRAEEVVERLKTQDEAAFHKVSLIYEQKMGSSIRAVGQESLEDFIRVAKETYCGPTKPFAGIMIIFDEFGRYLEFSVQKPHIAGSGALQQLFECVQGNSDRVYMLSFIQYELKAYVSRIAPELRDELNRYVTRYDVVRKVRLSTNLETLIANLMEKKNETGIEQLMDSEGIQSSFRFLSKWFPEVANHGLWIDKERFERVICKGCWPLHPISTWIFYKLSSAGKTLQQRSAFSLLADVYGRFQTHEWVKGQTIRPADLCVDGLVSEFLASERFGQQGAIAHAYESVLSRYANNISDVQISILKAVLLTSKTGIKIESKQEYIQAIRLFTGIEQHSIDEQLYVLENEYGVLEWNGILQRYEITGDAVPRSAFNAYLEGKLDQFNGLRRAEIFSQNAMKWLEKEEIFSTDFATDNNITTTREWAYRVNFSNISMLSAQIELSTRNWLDSREVDKEKGQLIYCYVGPESTIEGVRDSAAKSLASSLTDKGLNLATGAPVAVMLINDRDGSLGKMAAEYWILQEEMSDEEAKRYVNYVMSRQNDLQLEFKEKFSVIESERNLVFASDKPIPSQRMKNMFSQLFDVVYPKRIPFPFDGFNTSRGNAAKDSQGFIRELFKGNLDKEWISANAAQQRNRAIALFESSWKIFENDGSVRLKPENKAVREVIELIDSEFNSADDEKMMNLGKIMRAICSPPYGCNIASGGMLIAYFVGRRKNVVNLQLRNQSISIENWLQDAFAGNFLNLHVLDQTLVERVSDERMSEWDILLSDWELEKSLLGIKKYLEKAHELEKRFAVPQQLFYKYELIRTRALQAVNKLNDWDKSLSRTVSLLEEAREAGKTHNLLRAAADLSKLSDNMNLNKELWNTEHFAEVAKYLESARAEVVEKVRPWIQKQMVYSNEHLSKFKHDMLDLSGGNLKTLGLMEEKALLEAHVEKVEEQIKHITVVKNVTSDILKLTQNILNNSVAVSVISTYQDQIKVLSERLDEAAKKTAITKNEVQDARTRLQEFAVKCQKQLDTHKERMVALLNITEINSYGEIANLRNETAMLIKVYEGRPDQQDLILIQRQLDLFERHYRVLENMELSEDQLDSAFENALSETEEMLQGEAPLDTEMIYECLVGEIKAKREEIAEKWIKATVPKIEIIQQYDARQAMSARKAMENMPRVLTNKQINAVHKAINACELRLDELEVEGMVVKFNAMSERNKESFIQRILDSFKTFMKMGMRM